MRCLVWILDWWSMLSMWTQELKLVIQPARVFHTDVETQITQEVKKLLAAVLSSPFNIPNGFST